MKRIHPDDPRVTAHALDELPKHEAAEIARAAMTDAEVQASMDETRALAELIRKGFDGQAHELGEERREAIRRAGRQPVAENLVSMKSDRRWVRTLAIGGMAAALVAGAVWTMMQIPTGDGVAEEGGDGADHAGQLAALRMQMLLTPSPRPQPIRPGERSVAVAPSSLFQGEELSPELVQQEYNSLAELMRTDPGAFSDEVKSVAAAAEIGVLGRLPLLVDNPFVNTREEDRAGVPVAAGSASYTLVERWIRSEKRLPPRNLVRPEELINQVTYEAEGDADLEGLKLGVELIRCPWDEDAILMGILLRNESERVVSGDRILQVEVKAEHIRSFRLIGYARPHGAPVDHASLANGLQPGASNYILYQLQPAHREVFERHRVVVRVALDPRAGSEQILTVPKSTPPRDWELASNNLHTAVALGSYGMLLRDSPYKGGLSVSLLEALTLDAQRGAPDDDLVRREALQLVLDSLELLGKDPGEGSPPAEREPAEDPLEPRTEGGTGEAEEEKS